MKHLVIVFGLVVAACGGKSAPTDTTETEHTAEHEPTAAESEVVTLTNLETYDVGCYVWFSRDGQTEEHCPPQTVEMIMAITAAR